MRRVALLLVIGLGLASCTSHVSPPTPEPGVLSGLVLAHSSQKPDNFPLAGAQVGVYREAVSSGPPPQNPPSPVAMTTTDSAGEFRIEGLGKGRWFVIAPNEAGGGAWVSFDPAVGAVLTLIVCTDCPVPLATPPLDGTRWRLTGWTLNSLDPAKFTITASFAGGQISGNSGVNAYSGPYTLGPGTAFSVGNLAVGGVGGIGPDMRAETAYLTLLGQASSYRVEGSVLTLYDRGGNESLIFERAAT